MLAPSRRLVLAARGDVTDAVTLVLELVGAAVRSPATVLALRFGGRIRDDADVPDAALHRQHGHPEVAVVIRARLLTRPPVRIRACTLRRACVVDRNAV